MHGDGKEYITDLYNAGDFIEFTALIEDTNYDDTAVVIENAEIMLIPREDFLQFIYRPGDRCKVHQNHHA